MMYIMLYICYNERISTFPYPTPLYTNQYIAINIWPRLWLRRWYNRLYGLQAMHTG